jgi:hypothetical protein
VTDNVKLGKEKFEGTSEEARKVDKNNQEFQKVGRKT